MRKIIVYTGLIALFCVSGCCRTPKDDIAISVNSAKPSIVAVVARVDVDKFVVLGTGFFIDKNGHIATCAHVISNLLNLFIMKQDALDKATLLGYIATQEGLPQYNLPVYRVADVSVFIPVRTTQVSPASDIAILEAPEKNTPHLKLGEFKRVAVGNDLVFLGFPFGFNRVVAHKAMVSYKGTFNVTGNPADPSLEAVQIDGIVNRGNSGGPLISQGKVVGVIRATQGNIGPYLQAINEGKIRTEGIGLGQIDFGLFTREVVRSLDRHIQMGMGYAVSVEYLRKMEEGAHEH